MGVDVSGALIAAAVTESETNVVGGDVGGARRECGGSRVFGRILVG